MIDMEKYKRKIISIDKELKVKKNIRNSMIIFNLYVCIALIAIVILLFGWGGLIYNTKNGGVLYSIGMLVLIFDIIIAMSYETLDPLKNYSVNDKVFIYLSILYEDLGKDNTKKEKTLFRKQYLFFTIKKLNSQLYIIKHNIENTFIFRDEKYKDYVKYLENFILLFRGKDYLNKEFNRTEEIRKCIVRIISIYEFNVVNEFSNEDCNLNYKEVRMEKIKELVKSVDFILENDAQNSHDFKTKFNSKSTFSIVLLVVLNVMPLVFIAFKKDDIISFIFTVYSPIVTVNFWAWKNNFK